MLDHVVRARDRELEEVEDALEDGNEKGVEDEKEVELLAHETVSIL